jgi:hypothetical protein
MRRQWLGLARPGPGGASGADRGIRLAVVTVAMLPARILAPAPQAMQLR